VADDIDDVPLSIQGNYRQVCRHSADSNTRLVPYRGKVYCLVDAFLTATTSLGVLQPWPLPSSRLVDQEKKSGCL